MTLLFKALLGATLSSMTLAASAFTQGEGEPQGGMPHQYDIELKSLDMDKNHIGGRTSPFNWNLNGQYVVNFHCPVENISRGAILNSAIYPGRTRSLMGSTLVNRSPSTSNAKAEALIRAR